MMRANCNSDSWLSKGFQQLLAIDFVRYEDEPHELELALYPAAGGYILCGVRKNTNDHFRRDLVIRHSPSFVDVLHCFSANFGNFNDLRGVLVTDSMIRKSVTTENIMKNISVFLQD